MKKLILLFFCALSAVILRDAEAQNVSQVGKLEWPLRSNEAAPAGQEIAAQATAARVILDGWQGQNPVRGDRFVHLVYWTPADREPAPRFRERLSGIMLDIQAFYEREMERNGFGPRTFKLQKADNGLLRIYLARGDKPRADYSRETGQPIRGDAKESLARRGH